MNATAKSLDRVSFAAPDDLVAWLRRHQPSMSRYIAAVLDAQRARVAHAERVVTAARISAEQLDWLIGAIDEPEDLPGGRRLDQLPTPVADAVRVLAEERNMTDVR
jgi:hypothetical protein